MKIRTKVTLLSVLSVALSLATTAVVSVGFLSEQARAQTVAGAKADVAQADRSISLFVENQFQTLHSLAIDAPLWKNSGTWTSFAKSTQATKIDTKKYKPSEALATDRFQRLLDSFDHITQIEAGTSDGGYVMAPAGTKPAGYDPRQRPWYLAAASGKADKTGVRTTSEGGVVVSLVEPFATPTGSGVVSLSISLGDLTKLSDSIQIGKAGFVMLIQPDGTLVTSVKDTSLVGKNITKDKIEEFAGLDLSKEYDTQVTWKGVAWDVHVLPSPTLGWVFLSFLDPREYQEQAQTFLVVLVAISFAVLILAIAIAIWVSNRLSRPLVSVASGLKAIAEGEADLTVALPVTGNDEISELTRHFNTFLARLEALVRSLKEKAVNLDGAYHELAAALTENGASIHEITQSARLAVGRLEEERTMVSQASDRVGQLAEGLDRIQVGVEQSRAAIAQASTAIEEMAGNIESTSTMGRRGGETAQDLQVHADQGYEAMEELSHTTTDLAEASERIAEVVDFITGIAGQTNLLAMNAAIEAAHAGEAGKGFAVVAEEIRKLADQSSSGAREITQAVQQIIKTVASNGEKTAQTLEDFDQVRTRVRVVSDLSRQIASAMTEQSQANRELLSSVASMQDRGEAISSLASQETKGSEEIRAFLAELNRLSQEITASKDEEALGMEEINRAMAGLNRVSADLKAVADEMNAEFSRFKTR